LGYKDGVRRGLAVTRPGHLVGVDRVVVLPTLRFPPLAPSPLGDADASHVGNDPPRPPRGFETSQSVRSTTDSTILAVLAEQVASVKVVTTAHDMRGQLA